MKTKLLFKLVTVVFFIGVLGIFLLNVSFKKKNNLDIGNQSETKFENSMSDYVYDTNHLYAPSKTDAYDNLSSVENDTEFIVTAVKTDDLKTVIERDEEGYLTTIYSLSSVKISSVIKGNINPNESITILENEGYDQTENRTYHIAGYEKMIIGNKYLLCLKQSKTNPDQFIPTGVVYGKIPLNNEKSELMELSSKSEKEVMKEINAELNKVLSIQNELKEKYSSFF